MASKSGVKSIRSFFTAECATVSTSAKRARVDSTTASTAIDANSSLQLSETSASEATAVDENNTREATTANVLDRIGWKPFDELEPSWRSHLLGETKKPYFQRLMTFLESEYSKGATIFPPTQQIFTALNLCPFDNVKVVVIGQDPYHGPGQAHGLAFSVQRGIQIPPSLRNMITEATNDDKVRISSAPHGNLECWSRQGVLMLNAVLTVRKGEANSHQKRGWEEFTDAVVRELKKREGLVYLLWGKPAQSKCSGIDHSKNTVLTCSHPSPLSAYKTDEPFIGSKIFSRCNDALVAFDKTPIDWNIH